MYKYCTVQHSYVEKNYKYGRTSSSSGKKGKKRCFAKLVSFPELNKSPTPFPRLTSCVHTTRVLPYPTASHPHTKAHLRRGAKRAST